MAIAPGILLGAIKREKDYRDAEDSLFEFCRHAWHVIEPGQEFKSSWHLEAIAEHLEAIASGDIKNLLVNIPPGTSKSIFVSVMLNAWWWIREPSLRVFSASYGESLAVRDAQKTRAIILSDWYQARWPDVRIKKGEDQKAKFDLESGGSRMATGIGGKATGFHMDLKIVDDPHSAKTAQSDAERQTALDWFDQTLSTRGVSRDAATVVVMQRLHERDISGHIIDDIGGYTHLMLPMRYESAMKKPKTSIGFEDPRTKDGELLWPELFPEKVVKSLERNLGEYGASGQLQQRPSPAGGGILKTDHFQLWSSDRSLPHFDAVIQSWDTAFTERSTGDPSALTAWGFFTYEGKKCALLLDAFNDNLGYPALKAKVIEEWGSTYGEAKRRSDFILVEQKASGQSIIQDMRVAGLPVKPYNPGRADKVTRAHMAAPILETDCIYVLESKARPKQFVSWATKFVKECELFPNGAHDDLVDTCTQVIIYARDANLLASLENIEEDEEHAVDYSSKSRRNPYTQ